MPNPCRRIKAIEPLHEHIHQYDIRVELFDLLQSFVAVARFTDDFKSVKFTNQSLQTSTHHLVIVGE